MNPPTKRRLPTWRRLRTSSAYWALLRVTGLQPGHGLHISRKGWLGSSCTWGRVPIVPARCLEAYSLSRMAVGGVTGPGPWSGRGRRDATGWSLPPAVGGGRGGRTAMPTMGLVRVPVGWPRSTASPKAASDPSAPTAQ